MFISKGVHRTRTIPEPERAEVCPRFPMLGERFFAGFHVYILLHIASNYEGSVDHYFGPFMPFVTMSKWRREMLDIFLATLPELLISLLANNIQKPHRLSSSLILRTWLPVTPDLQVALSIDT